MERAASGGLRRNGDVSCGGATRLIAAADGWIAVALARSDDRDLVPAWLELGGPIDPDVDGLWEVIVDTVARRPVAELDDRAALVGLPVGVVPADHRAPTRDRLLGASPIFADLPVVVSEHLPARRRTGGRPPLVVDLSALWAGPLCSRMLQADGFDVVKVESTRRPDAARDGDEVFFDLLNAGKRSVALDLAQPDQRRHLSRLIASADIVIEASRPRALRQLGIDPERCMAEEAGPSVWVSITARGRTDAPPGRVGFGDDVAAAAGLVVVDDIGPCFCVDAIADPLSGAVAAAATRRAWRHGGRWILDVSMLDVAAAGAGPTLPSQAGAVATPPRPPNVASSAAPLGAHTDEVLAEWSEGGPEHR